MPSSAPGGRIPDPGFVGRRDELARLVDVLEAAVGGRSTLSLVVGEAGIGKSRLAGRLASEAGSRGLAVLWTEAEDGGGPFSALAGLRLGRVDGSEGSADDRRWEVLDDAAAAVEARAPALVVVEDVHWGDAPSLWVLERLARQMRDAAVAVVVTARGDEVDDERMARLVAAADPVVRLTGLSPAETLQLAALAAPGAVVDQDGLWERTGGVPLFVREAAVLAAEGGGRSLATGVLRRRIDRLGAEVARALGGLALAPPGTSPSDVAGALGLPVVAVAEAVDAARAEDLLVADAGGGVRFRHALLAEAAGAVLEPSAQRAFRIALADVLDAAGDRAAAAHQRLLALPEGDVAAVAATSVATVVELRDAGSGAEASALAALAVSVLGRYGAAPDVLARLHVERAEALFALGDAEGAKVSYDAAVAADSTDPEARARAETGRAWFANPFVPEPDTMRRLTEAAAAIGPEDSTLRAQLLGRIAVVSLALPAARDLGRSAGDEAVAMAHRLGDPSALVQALADRHLAPSTPEECSAREQAADELVALGERLTRPDIAVLGYEWQYGAHLGRAEVPRAEAALGRLELASHLIASPRWRFSAAVRRATLLGLRGERDRALDAFDAALTPARTWLQPAQALGVEAGYRMGLAFLTGVPDPRLVELIEINDQIARALPAGFFQATLAFSSLVAGDEARARTYLDRALPALPDIAVGLESLYGLNLCGLAAALLGDVDAANAVRPLLLPFADRLTAGSGAVVVPVATTLGLLTSLVGEVEEAVGFHATALTIAERSGSAMLVERCRALAGDQPRSDAAAAGRPVLASAATIVRTGDGWELTSPFGTASVADSRGLQQLVEVLRAGGREISAAHLADADGPRPVQSDLGPALDGRAKREYRARIAELRDDIDDAEALHDPERASLARIELEALLDELRRAVGLDGRDRPQGSSSERARVNVTRSIRRAIGAIAAAAPDLGAHLEVSVRTGRECSYRPDPAAALSWEVRSRA